MATIAYCATDMLAKVYIDRYLDSQQAIVRTIPFYRHQSIPIGGSDRDAMISIDTYCSM